MAFATRESIVKPGAATGDAPSGISPVLQHRLNVKKAVTKIDNTIADLEIDMEDNEKAMLDADSKGQTNVVNICWEQHTKMKAQLEKLYEQKARANASVYDVRMQESLVGEVQLNVSRNEAIKEVQGQIDIGAIQQTSTEHQMLMLKGAQTQKQIESINAASARVNNRLAQSSASAGGGGDKPKYSEDLAAFLQQKNFSSKMDQLPSIKKKAPYELKLEQMKREEEEEEMERERRAKERARKKKQAESKE